MSEDFCILEPVDRNDEPVPTGVFSDHILITNLLNDFHPFIRYRMEDEVRFLDEKCLCGSPLQVMEIRGRTYPEVPVIRDDGQESKIDSRKIKMSILSVPEVHRFQVKCSPKRWSVHIFIEQKNAKEYLAHSAKIEEHVQSALLHLSKEEHFSENLTIEVKAELFSVSDQRTLKQKMFVIKPD